MKTNYLLILILIVLFGIGGYFILGGSEPIACTLEAKICPDGSSVGRSGLKCEFASCPEIISTKDETVSWETYKNPQYGFEFKYPADTYELSVLNDQWFEVSLHDKRDRQIFNFNLSVNHPGIGFGGMSIVSTSKTRFGGIEATKDIFESEGHEKGSLTVLYSFEKNDNRFLVVVNGSYERADQIISTFKFTK